MGLEGFGSATFLFCSFFILKKEKRSALSHNPARGWEITRGSMQRGKKGGENWFKDKENQTRWEADTGEEQAAWHF